ncbi:recombinase family protein [Candidatus Nomurabacteria bacterium]|nr:recombinase family protein [Candidatus Nomurabacteria bacterium]
MDTSMNKENKAVIYARVSTREQEETGYSLESQKKTLEEYALKNSLKIDKIFAVSESASGKKDRQVFHDMLSYINTKNISNIICEKTDRLTRNPKDAGTINDWINKNENNKVHFVKESFVADKNTKAHEGLVWNMKVSIAKFYTDNLSEEVKKGYDEKVRQGWLPRPAKMGYKTIGESGHRIHVPDKDVAPLIKKMFLLYASGLHSLDTLTEKMYKEGLRTKKGKKVYRTCISNYLSDTFYYGEFQWGGKIHQGKHKPLITKKLFDKVQEIKQGKKAPKYSKHTYLFKGTFKCGECKGIITWEKQRGHVYGHCNGYRPCTKKTWYKEEEIEVQMSTLFSKLKLENKRFAEWLKKSLKESNSNEMEQREITTDTLKKDINKIERRLSVLYEDRLDERISVEDYDTKANELQNQKEELLSYIKSHSDTLNKSKELGITLFELSQKAPELYMKAEPEEKRKLASLVFNVLDIDRGQIVYEYSEPFKILARAVEVSNSSKVAKDIDSSIQIFEPEKNGSIVSPFNSLKTISPVLLPDLDSNQD